MSRLLIKNLPVFATPQRLRQHFEQKGCPQGTITDVKVAQKEDGTARRFGFVGYKTDADAAAAAEWFNNTFLGSVKLHVAVIDGAKDAPAPRPNKRARLGPSPHEREDTQQKKTKKEKKDKESAEKPAEKKGKSDLDEYLKLSKSRSLPAWANEEAPLASATSLPVQPQEEEQAPEKDVEMQVDEEPKETTELSDLEWMRRHTAKSSENPGVAPDKSPEDVPSVQQVPAVTEAKDTTPPSDDPVQTIRRTCRLFLRNLAYSCTEDELLELVSPFGTIKQAHIPLDPASNQPKGMAYITFAQPDPAVAAYRKLDKQSFQGRLLHILPAVDRRGNFAVEDASEGGKNTVKDDIKAKRKANAGKEFNWGMLYMNSDAVASSIADRLNIPKAELLNGDSFSNPAVSLALAETHIIQETKTYLSTAGVSLAALSSASRTRSQTVILVKNIPYGTSADAIREMFEQHGALKRVLVPPAGTIAVVEFELPGEASAAFRAVSYRRLGNSIVYLEKGPMGMFDNSAPVPSANTAETKPLESVATVKVTASDDKGVEAGTTLYVKNLAFSTTTERLTQVFSHLASFAFARVQMKPDPVRPGAKLSMGYGFIGFSDAEAAGKALKGIEGYVLDGHKLSVKFAGRGTEPGDKKEGKKGEKGENSYSKTTTKMIVKNVPFEASKKDLRELFGAHGSLKSLRLPTKFGARSRGFAFLDFTSRREAEHAYETLRYTHLLGRHLVLEWAQGDEEAGQDLEEMRDRKSVV